MSIDKKFCYRCVTEKPLAEFGRDYLKKDGKSIYCKSCASRYSIARRIENRALALKWANKNNRPIEEEDKRLLAKIALAEKNGAVTYMIALTDELLHGKEAKKTGAHDFQSFNQNLNYPDGIFLPE